MPNRERRRAQPVRPREPAGPALGHMAEMHAHAADAAALLKALGNEQRLLVLCNLVEGELSVGQLNERLDLSQSALSQHLALLRESGLVETRRESQSIFYSLPVGPVTRVIGLLQELYCSDPPPPGVARARRRSARKC